jgi:hypothetical protein
MAKIIFISGNDGSGKSTFCVDLAHKYSSDGFEIVVIRYYHNIVRRIVRKVVGFISKINQKKKNSSNFDSARVKRSDRTSRFKQLIRFGLLYVLILPYCLLMLAETRLRARISPADFMIVDRSYVDDIVSICSAFKLPIPIKFLSILVHLQGGSRIYYLTAGHEIEYTRVVDCDLSKDFHLTKSRNYTAIFDEMQSRGFLINKINTIEFSGGKAL